MRATEPTRRYRGEPLVYHHSRPIEAVTYGPLIQRRLLEEEPPTSGHPNETPFGCRCARCDWEDGVGYWDVAYRWLSERVGFWPLFLAVGSDPESQAMTGYGEQWRRRRLWNPDGSERGMGYDDQVLLSWAERPHPEIVYSGYSEWHWVLMSVDAAHGRMFGEVPEHYERRILKRSWSSARWLRLAEAEANVQAVVPAVDARTADCVRVRSRASARRLIHAGFDAERILVERWRVDPW